MRKKILSVFVDESGDFGQYNPSSPYYYVAMVLHNQEIDLICTVEAIAQKSIFTKSEAEFFHSKSDFKKNIYKNIAKKKL